MGEVIAPGTVYNPFLFDASNTQLEMLLLTGVVVAGKIARIQQDKLNDLMRRLQEWAVLRDSLAKQIGPFALIRAAGRADCLLPALQATKLGQYRKTMAAFLGLANARLDLRTCSRDCLCSIPGIGLKTASFSFCSQGGTRGLPAWMSTF